MADGMPVLGKPGDTREPQEPGSVHDPRNLHDTRNLHDQRVDYHGDLLPLDLTEFDPWGCFGAWFEQATAEKQAGRLDEPNAMVVSTVDLTPAGPQPTSRVVLLKEWDERGLVFFTHATSRKGRNISDHPLVSVLFWWPSLMRQVRIEGAATAVDRAETEAYFATRPRGSQLGAWASHQSEPLAGRDDLDRALAEVTARFDGVEVPCPPGWGGYRVRPSRFEFWQGQPSRLHDRVASTLLDGDWSSTRLNP
ncbi:pyridoxamine 5'-phosphate oxidase [Aestuariimicrobium sp. T2.26MG-19.2B]|uniref:pyridoxamine 5'-phosphate oxidase n=1 Tax=Aestuariimicrobium sp. T2.26MG-19.2B TaxID=3040679 RepID=UPI0024774313|nr:pyridoxamine 5'-phosphate oxidase [Aestuariimicrobium sp. T2.26MG-19.2B]CAI9400949.1 Pyridoxine/pyridoxamine 5'-phosphate oxidase [Aestuariimicrobium sp. T2.26MG-19.2B]